MCRTIGGLSKKTIAFAIIITLVALAKGSVNYYFLLNHTSEPVSIQIGPGYFDMLADKPAPASFTLNGFECRVLRK